MVCDDLDGVTYPYIESIGYLRFLLGFRLYPIIRKNVRNKVKEWFGKLPEKNCQILFL